MKIDIKYQLFEDAQHKLEDEKGLIGANFDRLAAFLKSHRQTITIQHPTTGELRYLSEQCPHLVMEMFVEGTLGFSGPRPLWEVLEEWQGAKMFVSSTYKDHLKRAFRSSLVGLPTLGLLYNDEIQATDDRDAAYLSAFDRFRTEGEKLGKVPEKRLVKFLNSLPAKLTEPEYRDAANAHFSHYARITDLEWDAAWKTFDKKRKAGQRNR